MPPVRVGRRSGPVSGPGLATARRRTTHTLLDVRLGEGGPFGRFINPDRVLGGAELAIEDMWLNPQAAQQPEHRRIAVVDQRGESPDALLQRALEQLAEQHGAKAPSLPVIDHGDRHFGGLVVVDRSDEARNTHATTIPGTQRDDSLVIVMVDVGEIAHLCVG